MNAFSPISQNSMLARRAMLAGLSIKVWSARKLDKRVTAEVNQSHGADANAGRYNKALIAKEALAAVTSAATAARTFHAARTLPWLMDGTNILPAPAYTEYSAEMRKLRVAFEAAADDFVAGYDAYVDDARRRLNGMFNETDYPSRDDIRRKFGFDVRMLPMPDSSDFRADLSDHQAAEVKRDIEESTRQALQLAMGDAWARVADTVGRMVERLNAYRPAQGKGDKAEGIFRDSLVENIRDLVAILPGFNLTNDGALAAITARMESDLCSHNADELREDPIVRQSVADAAQDILASVSQYLA